MIGDFRKFVVRGNVMDLAVGIIIGAAFATVVKSFVDDILMPPIGMATGGVDFSELYVNLGRGEFASRAQAVEAGAPIVSYGVFINNLITFLITAFAVYLLVRAYTRLREREAAAPAAAEKDCPFCRSRIHLAAVRCPACTSELSAAS
ncbi:MAG: large conductance mechanosensitive channel protein MscL [Gemmatimonadetes bacterium]|nr:large conductance mechanosensitive channel protein MscL [Gemmatimonadota bacterium]